MNIAATLLALCLQIGIDEQSCPTLVEGTDYPLHLRVGDVMTYVGTKYDKHYILYSEKSIRRLTQKEVSETLVHELTHYVMYAQDGINTHEHLFNFRKKCWALSEEANVSKRGCKTTLY